MPTALINGARLNYVQMGCTSGSAEDLVMVHGLATNLAFWYLPYASAFAERYRVTVFDLRGHGRSELTEHGYTPAALAGDLEGLLDHLDIASAHFVAHSFGGAVTLSLAHQAQERVRSLVLADTQLSVSRRLPPTPWPHSLRIQTLIDGHGLDLDVLSPHFGYDLLTAVAQLLLRDGEIPADLVELVGATLGKHQRRTARRWLELIAHARHELTVEDGLTREALRALQFPILAMYGDRSKARPTSDLLRPLWPHAEFITVEDAGHFFPTSRPTEVISACNQFWDTQLFATEKVAI